MLLKPVNDVVGNAKPLCFAEFMPQAANQFARAPWTCSGLLWPLH
jgi:hypothetical protein